MIPILIFLQLFTLIQVADIVTTTVLIKCGFSEGNAIMAPIVATPELFILVKMLAVLAVAGCVLTTERRYGHGIELSCGACCIAVLPVVNNLAILSLVI